jgi:PAT family beta-lactamase induction signal transducer AmpG
MTYKVGDFVASSMLIPFLMDIGFSRTDIGVVYKGFGFAATIVGCIAGGGIVTRLGLRSSLILFGILQAGANAFYMLLATVGDNYTLLVASIGIDHLFNGLGTTAFGALLISLCNKKFSATQYALFSSLMTLPGRLIGGGSGFIASAAGWPVFFGITLVAAAPALVLLTFAKLDSQELSR